MHAVLHPTPMLYSRRPSCRGPEEVYVLGGVTVKQGDPPGLPPVPPFLAKLNASSMEELWRVDLLEAPQAWRWGAFMANGSQPASAAHLQVVLAER